MKWQPLIEFAELLTGRGLFPYQKDLLNALSRGDRPVIRQYRGGKRFSSAEIDELISRSYKELLGKEKGRE